MPDIQLRFHKDMLVLSAPIDAVLQRQGIDAARDRQYLNLMEPDSISDALRMEVTAGAHCVVTTTEDITQARLAHVRMTGDESRLASAALQIANDLRPQHVLAEIGPCGLPLDTSSKASLNENRQQYAQAARAFQGEFDAFFLNGFVKVADLKCALMGVAQVSDKPVFASVTLGQQPAQQVEGARPTPEAPAPEDAPAIDLPFSGYELFTDPVAPPVPAVNRGCLPPEEWLAAVDAMVDLGAAVVGFQTAQPLPQVLQYVQQAKQRTNLPLLVQLQVQDVAQANAHSKLIPVEDRTDYAPDTLPSVAVKLYGAGVQFLRATGQATPACTGALAATVAGLDVVSN